MSNEPDISKVVAERTTKEGRADARARAVKALRRGGFNLSAQWIIGLIDDYEDRVKFAYCSFCRAITKNESGALAAHVMSCEKHPLRAALAKCEATAKELRDMKFAVAEQEAAVDAIAQRAVDAEKERDEALGQVEALVPIVQAMAVADNVEVCGFQCIDPACTDRFVYAVDQDTYEQTTIDHDPICKACGQVGQWMSFGERWQEKARALLAATPSPSPVQRMREALEFYATVEVNPRQVCRGCTKYVYHGAGGLTFPTPSHIPDHFMDEEQIAALQETLQLPAKRALNKD
jgi:hypothetical protein